MTSEGPSKKDPAMLERLYGSKVNMDHFRVAFGNEHSAVEFPIGKKVDFTQNRHTSKVIVHDNSPQSYK
jgi:hypothetical protein